jgi:hypothetical protein
MLFVFLAFGQGIITSQTFWIFFLHQVVFGSSGRSYFETVCDYFFFSSNCVVGTGRVWFLIYFKLVLDISYSFFHILSIFFFINYQFDIRHKVYLTLDRVYWINVASFASLLSMISAYLGMHIISMITFYFCFESICVWIYIIINILYIIIIKNICIILLSLIIFKNANKNV